MKRPTASRDVDLKTGKIEIKHSVIGGAKGEKGRTVYLVKSAQAQPQVV
jgi:integrase/recombinase XerD